MLMLEWQVDVTEHLKWEDSGVCLTMRWDNRIVRRQLVVGCYDTCKQDGGRRPGSQDSR